MEKHERFAHDGALRQALDRAATTRTEADAEADEIERTLALDLPFEP